MSRRPRKREITGIRWSAVYERKRRDEGCFQEILDTFVHIVSVSACCEIVEAVE